VSGSDILITGAICADLGASPALRSKEENPQSMLSTISGLVNGTGTLGAAIGQMTVGWISTHFSWGTTFYSLLGVAALSGIILIPMAIRDFNSIWLHVLVEPTRLDSSTTKKKKNTIDQLEVDEETESDREYEEIRDSKRHSAPGSDEEHSSMPALEKIE